jgi:hypothetical protein
VQSLSTDNKCNDEHKVITSENSQFTTVSLSQPPLGFDSTTTASLAPSLSHITTELHNVKAKLIVLEKELEGFIGGNSL